MKFNKKNATEQFAETIIDMLNKGTAPWQKPWDFDEACSACDMNAVSKKEYRGINVLRLFLAKEDKGYRDNRWLTYRQASEAGFQVRKGEHGTAIQFFQMGEVEDKHNIGEMVKVPMMKTYTVFNAEQIDGIKPIKPYVPPKGRKVELIALIERIVERSGAVIEHGGNRAFYCPSTDTIQLPNRQQFHSTGEYYGTLLHELCHWTGSEARLNRDIRNSFGTQDYAREELRAEIASWMIAIATGLPHTDDNSASYVASWNKKLAEDPKEIYRACSDAQKIKDFVMQFASNEEESTEEVA